MMFKILFSLLFILPLVGSLSVLIKGIRNEFNKFKVSGQKASTAKLIGYSILSLIGLYITIFLVCMIWLTGFDLPYGLKLFSYCLAAPYLFGVIGIGYALSKAAEVGASPTKMANSVSNGIKES
jgi:ABC-type multidrug transport system permease subunit